MEEEMTGKGSDWWGDKIREAQEEWDWEKNLHRKKDVRGGTGSNGETER